MISFIKRVKYMFNELRTKRSWVEIDLDQLVKNYNAYKSQLNKDTEIMVVVKAEAYGHGDLAICKILQQNGVKLFAVSNIDEAIALRRGGILGEILILGYTPCENAELLYKYELTQTLLDENYEVELSQKGYKIKAQFAIDTGMNRIGLDADDPVLCDKVIRKYFNFFNINGLFTHLCVADSDNLECVEFTNKQIDKFNKVANLTKDLRLKYIHCLNSAGGLFHKIEGDSGKIVRLGIVLYGLKPDYYNYLPKDIKPILSWKSVVSMVKEIKIGESVGYGRTFTATKNMKIATIPTGYADGYRRELSNKGYILINGQKAFIVGRVCMDQIMVDVTEIDCKMADEVVLIGQSGNLSLTADYMAQTVGTIGYEIVCGISKRVPRKYVKG